MAALSLTACATQPPYTPAAVSLPPTWANGTSLAGGAGAHASGPAAFEAWWTALNDPAVNDLVAAALADNPTLTEAAARVDQARAAVSFERAQQSPHVGIAASAARSRVGTGGVQGETTAWQSSASIGPSVSWEIDLWGRIRETRLAAESRLQARDADAADTRLSVAAQVADAVVALRACNLLLDVRDADILSRENELAIIRTRVRLGNLAPVDAAAAQTSLAVVQIDRIAQDEVCLRIIDALVALSGRPTLEVRSILAVALPQTDGPTDLAAQMPRPPAFLPGLPAEVLLAHPGVVAAEREVAARWSEIATARAERLPRLDLTGLLTGQWIGAMGTTASLLTGSIGAGLSAPLFDGGAGRAEVDLADARYREAAATLLVTLRRAVRDIEDGLAAQASAGARFEAAGTALSAARLTLRGNEARRRAGSIGAFEREDTRRQLNRAQESAIIALRDRAQAWVELVRRSGANPGEIESGSGPAAASATSSLQLANSKSANPR